MFAQRNSQMKFLLRFAAVGLWLGIAASITLARTPLKFDEFGNIPCADEVARLDNYGSRLRNVPDALAVVVVYGGRLGTRHGEVAARLFAIRDHLMNHNSIDASRIIILDGGFRESLQIQLWMIPSEGRSSATFLVDHEPSPRDVHLKKPAMRKWVYKCRRKLN